jgi:hypothetical protein
MFAGSRRLLRHSFSTLLLLVVGMAGWGCGGSGGGGGAAGLTEQEKDVLYYTNMARTDPQGFAEQYLADAHAGGTDNGAYDDLMSRDPVPALEIHEGLLAAARAHATDMAENCGLQHNSCDGTTFFDRVSSYYDGSIIGENAAMGYPDGLSVVIGWIIDQGIPSLGHRNNLLDGRFEHIGIGYDQSYWVQDFGAGAE